MAAFRSAARGDRRVGWRAWGVALLGAWLIPSAMGLAVLGAALALGQSGAPVEPIGGPSTLLALHGAGWLLLVSPLLSWVGLILLTPMIWALLRLGLAGWINTGAVGAAAGSMAGGLVDGMAAEVTLLFGLAGALILRTVLGWVSPAALTVD